MDVMNPYSAGLFGAGSPDEDERQCETCFEWKAEGEFDGDADGRPMAICRRCCKTCFSRAQHFDLPQLKMRLLLGEPCPYIL